MTNRKRHASALTREDRLDLAPPPPVPAVVVDAVTDMLMQQQDCRRRPEKAAALLALIVELYRQDRPFPQRRLVAEALDCSVFTIDAAISTRLQEGYITQTVETPDSTTITKRKGTVHYRKFIPSKELIETVEHATRKKKTSPVRH